jgi:glycosyltransferase involved in cell wall biosynthesis
MIYCPDDWHSQEANVAPNVTLRRFSRVLLYTDVIADMAGAFAVAIPLAHTDRAVALSELADAFALGKPVIVTRSEHIDFDVGEIGCGIALESKDIDGWARAITQLASNRVRAAEMGAQGKSFAEQHWNATISARSICTALEERFDNYGVVDSNRERAQRNHPGSSNSQR